MHDLILQLLGYVRGVWRFRWWILGIAWLVSVVGWVVVAKLPDQYEASARVYVDTETLLKPLLRGLAVRGDERQRLLLMSKTLLSRPNLEKVMRMADLDLQAKTEADTESIIGQLTDNIKLETTRDINLYTIGYEDAKPELAKLVVKSLLTIFVESNLGDTRKDQDSARQFLERQIAEYEKRLEAAEGRRAAFKQKNLAYLTGDKGGYYQRLQSAYAMLSQAELELKIQQDRLDVLRQQVEGELPSFGIVEEPLVTESLSSPLDSRIAGLEAKLDDLLLRYTARHPDVVAVKATMRQLKAQREREMASSGASSAAAQSSLDTNPVYQQMRISFAEVEADVAAKQAVVTEYKTRIENLKAAVDMVLQVEAEEIQLDRDYGILKEQHQELMERLESARLSHDVDARSDSVRFRIVDPPRVPPSPTGPPRVLLSSAVLLAALAFGVVLAFLMSQLRPTFDDRRLLNEITDLPVLGSVSMIWTSQQLKARKRRHLGFLFGLLALISAYGVVTGSYIYQVDWTGYLGSVRSIAGL